MNYNPFEKKEILELHYNYRPPLSDGKEMFFESWDSANITDENVVSITEHPACGEGDKWFYDVEYKDGKIFRTFNPCGVVYRRINEGKIK